MLKKLLVLLIIMLFLSSCLENQKELLNMAYTDEHPRLFFTEEDKEMLNSSLQESTNRLHWNIFLRQANLKIDPLSTEYADPSTLDQGRDGHFLARRFTRWMENLGFAYQITGDESYGRHGVKLLVTAADTLSLEHPMMTHQFAGIRGDMMRGLAIGYDWLYPLMTEEEINIVRTTMKEYLSYTMREYRLGELGISRVSIYHNWNGVSLGAAGCVALLLGESQEIIDLLIEGIEEWLSKGFDEQGAYYEGINYALYGLENVVLFADALLAEGIDLFKHPSMERLVYFFTQQLLPGENVFEARNNSPYGGWLNLSLNQIRDQATMLRIAEGINSGLARWLWEYVGRGELPFRVIWDNDIKPISPSQYGLALTSHFSERGLVVSRTGWEQSDIMFAIEAGEYKPGTHDHSDVGAFTLYGLGSRWAIDSGFHRYGSEAHNLVHIDGKGQALSGGGIGTSGQVIDYQSNEIYDYVAIDQLDAYLRDNRGRSNLSMQKALRYALFVKPSNGVQAYVVIADDIQKDNNKRNYEFFLHTSSDNKVDILEDKVVLYSKKTASKAEVNVLNPEEIKIKQDVYDNHPRIILATEAINPYFLVTLMPMYQDDIAPIIETKKKDNALLYTIIWPERIDTIRWEPNNKEALSISIAER